MRAAPFCLAILLCVSPLLAAESPAWRGEPLSAYLEMLNERGLRIIYTSDLVTGEMRLVDEPDPDARYGGLPEILEPFGLTVRPGPSGSLLIVRDVSAAPAAATPRPADVPIPEIVVTASLHRLQYARPDTHTYFDREMVTRLPVTAEEAVRVVDRIPGTANGGVSTRSHVRGGEVGEVLFLFDGVRLYEPYHLKDFQAIASVVNSNAIGGMDFYTGAYPANFGDRMSGVLSIDMREPEKARQTELAASFFNLSLLSMGEFGDGRGDWLVAGRRGNLDLVFDVLDPERGDPSYQDYLGHVGWTFGPRADLSANFLISDDKISLNDPDRGESAGASYRNRMFWLKWGADWTDSLRSDSILALSDVSNARAGTLSLPGIVAGELDESREFTALDFRQDWEWRAATDWMIRAGFDVKDLDADYRFRSVRDISPPFDAILDNESVTERDSELAPSGRQFAAYTEFRWRPVPPWIIELGLRWDRQDYTLATGDRQYSPRMAILYQPDERTEMRLGWGHYYQSQEINELQVSDGTEEYFPAQHAEHLVFSLEHGFESGIDLGLSLYRKKFRSLRPRFENVFNSLTLLPELQFDRIRVAPVGAEAIGAELTVSRGSSDQSLFWWLSYAWASAEDEFPSEDVKRAWDQTHTVKAGVSWRWRRWDFSVAGEVHTGWPKTLLREVPDGDGDLALAVTPRNSLRYTVFHSLDARISRRFDISRGDLTAFLEITNLYDRANPCCIEYRLDGGGSLASREAHWLPLVPSLGVVWRF